MPRFRGLALLALAIVAILPAAGLRTIDARAAEPRAAEPPVVWLTGDKLHVQLDQKVGATWAGISLRRALASLSLSQRVAIVLDRRVDPDQKIELTLEDVPLDVALKRIAQRAQIGVGQVGSVFYFGPEVAARRVRTLAALARDEVLKLPPAIRNKLLQPHPWRWEDATVPRELLADLATQCGVKIDGLERIPHDLWAAADLPPLNFCDRLTLAATQFDLAFHFSDDGETVKLVDMPESVEISRSYPIPSGITQSAAIIKKLAETLPEAHCDIVDGKLLVRGSAEDQEFVDTYLSGRTAKKIAVVAGKKVYQLTIVMPVGELIEKLGPKLDFDVRIEEAAINAAGLSLKTEVKVDVKNVSAEELLTAVLAPAGLTFDRQGRVVTVHPKK